jgi:hypothetical protein
VSAYLTRLHSLLGTPGRPVTPVPWDLGYEQTGFKFPEDYRQFADEYGSANINKTLGVMCPQLRPAWYSRGSGIGGFEALLNISSVNGPVGQFLARARARGSRRIIYPPWPEPGGLVLWGSNVDSVECYWTTEGDDPDRWPIVVMFGANSWGRFEGGFLDFLEAVIHGTWESSTSVIGRTLTDGPLVEQLGGWADEE